MDSRATVLRNRLVARARLRHLQVLVRIAELGSVQRAADAIDMSQPAVSHVLADLESLLGCALFHRQARGMRPTAVGATLLPLARRVLATVDDSAELVGAATRMAQELAAGPTFAHAMTKTMLQQEWAMTIEQAIEAEAQAQAICMQTQDFRRAYEAFAAKQKPVFGGD